jgi:hypothetical protein
MQVVLAVVPVTVTSKAVTAAAPEVPVPLDKDMPVVMVPIVHQTTLQVVVVVQLK